MDAKVVEILVESSILFSLLFLGIMLIRRLFQKKMSVFFQYALWAVVLLKLMIPVGIPAQASPWNALNDTLPQAVLQDDGITVQPLEKPDPAVQNDAPAAPEALAADGLQDVWEAQPPAPAAPEEGTERQLISTPRLLVVIWIAGIAAVGLWLMLGVVNLKRNIKRSAAPVPNWVREEFVDCKKRLGIKRKVRLVMQDAISVPCLIGIAAPCLVLPAGLMRDKEKVRGILTHELTHFRHFDNIINLLLNILNTIYWFHPLVWLAFGKIRRDMEYCCDKSVLRVLGEGVRPSYIDTVLTYAGSKGQPAYQITMGLASPVKTMRERIEAMFRTEKKTKKGAAAVALLLIAVLGFACFTTACAPITESIAQAVDTADESRMADASQQVGVDGKIYTPKADTLSVLLLGVDSDGSEAKQAQGERSDMMLLLTADMAANTISLTSLPRDTRTNVHEVDLETGEIKEKSWMTKLNHAYNRGGGQEKFGAKNAMRATQDLLSCEGRLSIPIDYYVSIDLGHLAELTDALGGVEVTLDQDFSGLGSKGDTLTLNGDQARVYLQNRKQMDDGEMDRQRHERSFMTAILGRIREMGAAQSVARLFTQLGDTVKTNLTLEQAVALAGVADRAAQVDQYGMTETSASWQMQHDELMGMDLDFFVMDEQELLHRMLGLYYTETGNEESPVPALSAEEQPLSDLEKENVDYVLKYKPKESVAYGMAQIISERGMKAPASFTALFDAVAAKEESVASEWGANDIPHYFEYFTEESFDGIAALTEEYGRQKEESILNRLYGISIAGVNNCLPGELTQAQAKERIIQLAWDLFGWDISKENLAVSYTPGPQGEDDNPDTWETTALSDGTNLSMRITADKGSLVAYSSDAGYENWELTGSANPYSEKEDVRAAVQEEYGEKAKDFIEKNGLMKETAITEYKPNVFFSKGRTAGMVEVWIGTEDDKEGTYQYRLDYSIGQELPYYIRICA
ncbi:M56 family metallopeptidase [Christensenella hongkongensis]|uniref:M56 family metallopeptidase n=1 Tax=Christensenella hongkongensis TaxID=270498 RepID=UPI002673E1EC|nr:M56 family metallopeptidase [Christensenella hongkongensis]